MPKIHKYLALVALGSQREHLADDLVHAVEKRGCEVAECRVAPLGQHFSASLLLTGNWSALGKLESALPGLANTLDLKVLTTHTEIADADTDYRPYAAEIIAPQHGKLLGELLRFFAEQDVRVIEINAQAYESTYTGAALTNINMALHVPLAQHPQSLRESFMDLCDDLHADGLLDPIKT